MNITATATKNNGHIVVILTDAAEDFTLTYVGREGLTALAAGAAAAQGVLNPMTATLTHNMDAPITAAQGPHEVTVTFTVKTA